MHKAKFMIMNIDFVYPIGSIYLSINSTNPSKGFGGTWVAWGTGRVPVGVNTSDSSFNTVEKTGGEKAHTLTVQEMPSHNHSINSCMFQGENHTNAKLASARSDSSWNSNNQSESSLSPSGGGQAHNNLQPYITCYMWKRTA